MTEMEFAMSVLARECAARTFGTVAIYLQDGQIVRVLTSKSEMPKSPGSEPRHRGQQTTEV